MQRARLAGARRGGPRLALVTTTVAMLVLAACNGDSSDSGSTPAPPAAAPVEPATSDEPAPADTGFVFGLLGPGAGLLDDLAVAQRNAAILAIEDINEAGGVLDQPAAGVYADERTDGSVLGALSSLLSQGAQGILGPASSASAAELIPLLQERQSLACSGSATVPALTADGVAAGSFVRTALPDQVTVGYVLDQIIARRDAAQPAEPWRVAILARDDDYGNSVGAQLAGPLEAQGVVPTVISYLPEQVTFTSEVEQAAAVAPDLVVMVTYGEAPRLLDGLIDGGIAAASIVGLDGAFTPRLPTATFPSAPERVDGVTVMGNTGSRAFLDRLAEEPGEQVIYGPQLYDCVVAMALAAQSTGSFDPLVYGAALGDVTGEGGRVCSTYADCLTQLQAGEDIDYDGVTGPIGFDANGDPTAGRMSTATFAGGRMTEVSSIEIDLAAEAADAAQEAALASAAFTASVQQALRALGYYDGAIDGIWDDDLTAAVAAFQTDAGLPVTGEWDAATDQAVRDRLGAADEALTQATISLQIELTRLGYYNGPIDGVYSRAVVDAVRAFQATLGVPQTGVLDAATLQAIYERGVQTPPPTTAPPPPPPTTAAPEPTPEPTPKPTPKPTEPPETPAPDASPTVPVPPETTVPLASLIDVLRADPDLSQFVALAERAGTVLTDRLTGVGELVVFAPTNAAMDALDSEVRAGLDEPDVIADFIAYHLLAGRTPLSMLATPPGQHPTLADGVPLQVVAAADGGPIRVNEATVVRGDVPASNGLINTIDEALLVPGT